MKSTVQVGMYTLLFFGLGIAIVGQAAGRERQQTATRSETGLGLRTATFETLHGKVVVNLPDDMAAGDTISGLVIAEPAGKTEEERQRNTDELNGYVVEVGDARTSMARKSFKWAIPLAAAGAVVPILLRDKDQRKVGKVEVPLQPKPPLTPPPATSRPEDYQFPVLAQARKPFQITGPFGGDADATGLKMGGKEVRILAESPRKVVGESPSDIIGPTNLELKEGDVVAKGKINNVRVTLTMPRTLLHKDEQSRVTASFEGLQDAPPEVFPIQCQLINRTPEVAELGGGATTLSQQIPRSAVTPGGTCAFTTPVRALQTGGFTLVAVLGDAWLGIDGWEGQKALLKTSEDFNNWIDGLKKDLAEYAKKQGNDAVGRAQKANAENAAENLPKSQNENDLDEKKALADALLRPISVIKAAASLWLSGYELYKAAIKAIVGTIGGEEGEIPWDAIDKGLDFLDKEADALHDKELKKRVKDARTAKDAAKKANGSKDKLQTLKDALDKANQQYGSHSR